MFTWIEIKKQAIKHNLGQFKKIIGPKVKLMAVVKSNAYGHGMVEIAKIALKSGANWLGVANLDEALMLRRAKIKAPIFILSYWEMTDQVKEAIKQNIDFPIYTFEQAEFLSNLNKKKSAQGRSASGGKINIHIKIDTGATRIGVSTEEAVNFIKNVKNLPNLNIVGIFTHYAESESKDQSYTNQQTEKFQKILSLLRFFGIKIPLVHSGCSASTINNSKTFFNLVRVGLGMYGLYPSNNTELSAKKKKIKLEPVLSWKTKIIQIKNVPAGTFVGYDRTFQTDKATKLAVLPIGFFDGYDRHLSGCGQVLIRGKYCPIRGRICMNLMMVDVSKIPDIKEDEEVILIGKQGKNEITVDDLAKKIGTINYETVCRINSLILRKYV
ncbi:MAG: alanine racemase [Patescibacteria group bacterium]|nr:alanine racemase [Patescibacteria group bacterium]